MASPKRYLFQVKKQYDTYTWKAERTGRSITSSFITTSLPSIYVMFILKTILIWMLVQAVATEFRATKQNYCAAFVLLFCQMVFGFIFKLFYKAKCNCVEIQNDEKKSKMCSGKTNLHKSPLKLSDLQRFGCIQRDIINSIYKGKQRTRGKRAKNKENSPKNVINSLYRGEEIEK